MKPIYEPKMTGMALLLMVKSRSKDMPIEYIALWRRARKVSELGYHTSL